MRVEEFERLQAFLLVSIGLYVLFTLWILPGLTSAVTGISLPSNRRADLGSPRHVVRHRQPLHRPPADTGASQTANAIVEVGSANGVFQEKLDYWIKGEGAQLEREPRWSIARNVLGWWK